MPVIRRPELRKAILKILWEFENDKEKGSAKRHADKLYRLCLQYRVMGI